VAIVGGADSLCRLTYAGFNALRVVDEDPCRPFRAGRAGMNLGEGAGVLVLESRERALERRALVFGELLGVGNSCDAHHMTAPHPEGLGAALAIERALADAGLEPEDIDFINAHGTGTPLNDASEWNGFVRVFGEERARSLPVTATKASVGHLLGSSGAIEAIATLQCLRAKTVHPTPRSPEGAPGGDDLEVPVRLVLGEALPVPDAERALSTSFGFGGANAAAVFAAPEGPAATGADRADWFDAGAGR
jgi:3-oxoacyl-(acyl-carrier-protein) synthase